jgi:hypothetical protein
VFGGHITSTLRTDDNTDRTAPLTVLACVPVLVVRVLVSMWGCDCGLGVCVPNSAATPITEGQVRDTVKSCRPQTHTQQRDNQAHSAQMYRHTRTHKHPHTYEHMPMHRLYSYGAQWKMHPYGNPSAPPKPKQWNICAHILTLYAQLYTRIHTHMHAPKHKYTTTQRNGTPT